MWLTLVGLFFNIDTAIAILFLSHMLNIPWTPQEDVILKTQFAAGGKITQDVMPLLPGRSYNAIRARAQKYLKVRIKPLFTYKKDFFTTPNEVNCSIAGFLAADGHIADNGRLTVNLARKDREHLETIIRLLEYTGNIYDYNKDYDVIVKKYGKEMPYKGTCQTSTIQIQGPELCADLAKYWNITPRKTFTLCPPNITDLKLIMAFISGMIDGDGWIVNDKEDEIGVYSCSIAIIGTREMIQWIKDVFDSYVKDLREGAILQPTESKNIFDYKISGSKTYWLAKIFLSLDVPRLDRKWDKLRVMVERIEDGLPSSRWKTNIFNCRPTQQTLDLFNIKAPVAFLTSFPTPTYTPPPSPPLPASV